MARTSNRTEGASSAAERQAGRPYAASTLRTDFSEPADRKVAQKQSSLGAAPSGSIAAIELTLGF